MEMEAALLGKKPALPPRPDSSCSHTSSVTYLSRISQLELLNQELEVQLQVSLAENLKLKEQVKRYASEELRWVAVEQELKTQISTLTDSNLALNSTVSVLQSQLSTPVPALPARHSKAKSLATDPFPRTTSTSAKEAVASVSLHIRDMRPAFTEASTEDLHVQTVSLTEISGNHVPLQTFYRTTGRKELENTRPMRDRSGSASRLGVAKYTPFSVRMVKRTKEVQETHVNVPKVSEVKQGTSVRTQRRTGGSVDLQFLSL